VPRRSNGEGSIVQRPNGLWQASIWVDGARRYVYGKTRAEVAKKLGDVKADANAGQLVATNRTTLSEYLTDWLTTVLPSLKPTTAALYSDLLRIHVKPAIGSIKLQALKPMDVQRCYAGVHKRRSAATVKNVHIALHKALEDARRWKLIGSNPAADAVLPKATPAERQVWGRDEAMSFARYCQDEGTPYGALWLFLLGSGCRLGEALGLRWADVDLDAGSVRVERAVSFVHGKPVEGTPKSRAGRRAINLPDFAVAALRAHRKLNMEHESVFATRVGTVPGQQNLRRSFLLACGHAKVKPIRIHDLRHVHATQAIYAGIDPKTLQKRLGHATLAMTLGLYTHAVSEADKEAAARFDGLMSA
jgi:integrase